MISMPTDTTHDPRKAVQFPTRKAAEAHLRLIHWPITDARPITVMGFQLWTIADEHQAMLTWRGLKTLLLITAPDGQTSCGCEAHRVMRAEAREETSR